MSELSTGSNDAPDPTSRSAFRLLAKRIDATNRDADTLRRALLAQWSKHSSGHRLVLALESLGGRGDVDAQLAVWFSFADPSDGQLVAADDSVLDGVSDELRARLAGTARPAPAPTED